MSIALPNRASSARVFVPWGVLALGLALIVVNLALMARGRSSTTTTTSEAAEPANGDSSGLPSKVTLTDAKFQQAAIVLGEAEMITLPAELGVPGRIDTNQDRQVQVHPRAAGVIREVRASLGQVVKKGDVLAVLDSPDVGTARLNLRAKQRELVTARVEAEWKMQLAANVASLIPELMKRTDTAVLEKQYANRPLGSFRGTLLTAYSKFDIAAHEELKTEGLRKDLIVGEHPAVVAHHNRESAQAEFEGVIEQAKFDAKYQNMMAEQQVKLAESAVIDAAKRLQILGVTENVSELIAKADQMTSSKPADEDVAAYTVVAPFDATVITKSPMAVPSQKAELTDVLFALADLSTVWVTANVPESDFALLPELQKGKIRLSATAYPGRSFAAKILSVGATVDPTTRTVSMLASTNNAEGLLKIGMFVRIVLDTSAEVKALAVPSSAVEEIEGKTGVFLPVTDDKNEGHTFAFRAVKLGRESGDRQVINSGLKPGESVVFKGAFVLKSELILQSDTEED